MTSNTEADTKINMSPVPASLNRKLTILEQLRQVFWGMLMHLWPPLPMFDGIRRFALKGFGFTVHPCCRVRERLSLLPRTTRDLTFGNCFINSDVRISIPPPARLVIKDGVMIGPRVTIEAINHNFLLSGKKMRGATVADIVIEENAWIGVGAIVLQGVRIGRGSVVAAGSVVTKSVPDNTLVGGVPAEVLKKINETPGAE